MKPQETVLETFGPISGLAYALPMCHIWPMAELTQAEADALFAMMKRAKDVNASWTFPGPASSLCVPLEDLSASEEFLLDISRGSISLKATFQNRHQQIHILARLDIGGPPHRNPDGQVIACPHLHLYREGYADKWAHAVPFNIPPGSLFFTLGAFMSYCNIVRPPQIADSLF